MKSNLTNFENLLIDLLLEEGLGGLIEIDLLCDFFPFWYINIERNLKALIQQRVTPYVST